PLWNRKTYTDTYSVYASDVMVGLGYPGAEDPITGAGSAVHVKSRICLSCHDGTIAIGSLQNIPAGFSGDIPMVSGVTTMPLTAAGYIGLDLRDDHPVAVQYRSGAPPGNDPELKGTPSNTKIRLYTAGANTYVECTTCHDSHDNVNGNFLVMSNSQSGLCIGCHTKTGFESSSIHATAALGYTPPNEAGGFIGNTVGEVKCMNCHFPHKAGVSDTAKTTPAPARGTYLMSFKEEQSCFNTNLDRWGTAGSAGVCHGSGGTKNIQSLVNGTKTYDHAITEVSMEGRHEATEGQAKGWINAAGSLADWHAECADCHNPHTAGSALHTPGGINGNRADSTTSPLYGTGGVNVVGWPTWTLLTNGSYSYLEPRGVITNTSTGVTYEYQICFKCHTDFAWGAGTVPTAPSDLSLMTNAAVEFNPGNNSVHPVVNTLLNKTSNVTPEQLTAGQMKTAPIDWSNVGNQTMYCSDCHGNDAASPVGPHGSNNRSLLKGGTYPLNGSGVLWSLNDFNVAAGTGPAGLLCLDCHPMMTGANTWANNVHDVHYSYYTNSGTPAGSNITCVVCHTGRPHGARRSRLIVYSSENQPYDYDGAGTAAGVVNGFIKAAGPTSYGTGNCSTLAVIPGGSGPDPCSGGHGTAPIGEP
ncbi:MAG TPA: hypothetical protein DCO77_01610, partial [Nitrospiraceae bacterium]|nr:hypothetical protein [Nitrospiraceae bacterium]